MSIVYSFGFVNSKSSINPVAGVAKARNDKTALVQLRIDAGGIEPFVATFFFKP
jgi:hypothetical protein